MKTLIVSHKKNFKSVAYDIDKVESIEIGQMKNFYSYTDIIGNGYSQNDSCIKINFKDMSVATFGKDWVISFE